jgi:hypothetical protein
MDQTTSPTRRSWRLYWQTVTPTRCKEFIRRREWFLSTSLDYLPLSHHRHGRKGLSNKDYNDDDDDDDDEEEEEDFGENLIGTIKTKKKKKNNNNKRHEINLSPPGPSVILSTKKDAQSPQLEYFCLTHPISVVRGLGLVLRLDLGLFSTKTLVETDPGHIVEVIYVNFE